MKKIMLMGCFSAAFAVCLVGCNNESNLDKTIKEGTETSKNMAGKDRPIPRVVIQPDTPPTKTEGGK
jgi:hypothetical protein